MLATINPFLVFSDFRIPPFQGGGIGEALTRGSRLVAALLVYSPRLYYSAPSGPGVDTCRQTPRLFLDHFACVRIARCPNRCEASRSC